MPPPANVKQLRSFLGMVNFFRDSNLSILLIPLTALTKKGEEWLWNSEVDSAFHKVKEAVMNAQDLVHMNDEDPVILYTDASTLGVGAVLMQVQNKKEVPVCFLSKKFSSAAMKWSTIEQECFGMFYAVMKFASYLLGRKFSIATDHKNLVYLQNSTVPKLVRWRLRLMAFQFNIIHIPGEQNVVADALSRVFRIKGKQAEIVESVHNEIVGHHGVNKTLKMIRERKLNWPGYKEDVKQYIQECPVCQKIKYKKDQEQPEHGYHIEGWLPMQSLSVDTVGPLPEDMNGYKYILCIVDNFSKFCSLFPTKSTDALSYVNGLIRHIGVFGVMKSIRSDGGTQFTAHICSELSKLLKYEHLVIVPYHPQANGLVERRNAEVLKHLRAIVMSRNVNNYWSDYLPLVQRIMNYTEDSSIGTYPANIIFGDMLDNSMSLDIEADCKDIMSEYLIRLKNGQRAVIEASQLYIKNEYAKKAKDLEAVPDRFHIGDYVLVTYPSRSPSKLSPVYKGPLKIAEKKREDLFVVVDIANNKKYPVHVSRLRKYEVGDSSHEDLIQVAANNMGESLIEKIVDHRYSPGKRKTVKNLEFRVRWSGCEEDEDEWFPYAQANEFSAMDEYSQLHPELKIKPK